MRTVIQDVDSVLAGKWYRLMWAPFHKIDAGKVALERSGKVRPLAADPWARTFIEAIRVGLKNQPGPPPPPPPPPPPTTAYAKVAPRVAYKTDRGDARYCMFNPDGSLRPGVTRLPSGQYTDESGAKYAADGDGLEESAIRSPGSAADCPTSASNIDGRPYCSLPMVGDPTKNTGSWLI